MAKRRRIVFVGMSGGVDSSVAAALLKKQGHEVIGAHMRCYNVDGCAAQDAEDARRAAEHLQIPFYVFDFEEEYKRRVVDYMVEGYRQGITPNPDVMCNREIKFGLFLEKALVLGADYVATGHYVRLRRTVKNPKRQWKRNLDSMSHVALPIGLFAARDATKDQSYFLWTLTQDQLRHCLFPIGDYLKSEVRQVAREFGLPNAEKKDSQGICFLGQVTLADFLKEYIPAIPGLVMTVTGKKVGEHEGAELYTIGQRHIGTQIANRKSQIGGTKPFYVIEKKIKTNTLVVATDGDPILLKRSVNLTSVHLINPSYALIRENKRIRVYTRVRYRQFLIRATLKLINPSRNQTATHQLIFNEPIKFVAPGQSAVFYTKQGEMLGGGIITHA